MRFVSCLVWVPSIDGKLLDSGCCDCSCLGPTAGLKFKKFPRRGKKESLKMQGKSFYLVGTINCNTGYKLAYSWHSLSRSNRRHQATVTCQRWHWGLVKWRWISTQPSPSQKPVRSKQDKRQNTHNGTQRGRPGSGDSHCSKWPGRPP